MINEAGIIQKWNACASSTFGYSAGDTIGKNISLLMPEPHRSQHDSYLKRYLDTGEHRVIGKAREVPVLTKKGKRLTCTLKVACRSRHTYTVLQRAYIHAYTPTLYA